MHEKRSVTLTIQLPRDIAAQAEEVARTDPEFLSRVVLYGLTRRSIYRHLREGSPDVPPEPAHFPGAGPGEVHLFAEGRR